MTHKVCSTFHKWLWTKRKALMGQGVIVLVLTQCAIAFISWVLSAIAPRTHVCSLLSSNGVRWICGQFTQQLASPFLVWLLFVSVAYGALRRSGITQNIRQKEAQSYRQKMAFRLVWIELVCYVAATVFLAFVPHALLLGIDGRLFPSNFSHSLIPQIAGVAILVSITYGCITDKIRNATHLYEALTCGIASFAPVFLYYILVVQLVSSFCYVFGI